MKYNGRFYIIATVVDSIGVGVHRKCGGHIVQAYKSELLGYTKESYI